LCVVQSGNLASLHHFSGCGDNWKDPFLISYLVFAVALPLQETVKTRMQVSGSSISVTVSELAGKEGIAAFWKGLTFAYGRELSYTSVKLGAYAPVRDAMGAGKDAPFYMKFLAGAITGGVGSAIGNPFDVLKTLAQTNKDKSIPLMTLVKDMYTQQGIAGFYRGVEANIMRACVLNATKMGCYDISKGYVMEASKSSILFCHPTHFSEPIFVPFSGMR